MHVALGAALAVFAFGFFLTPNFLITVGVMDMSLQSGIEMVRRVAHLEVEFIRWSSMGLGLAMAIVALRWNNIKSSPRFQAFVAETRHYPSSYESILPQIVTRETIFIAGLMAFSLLYLIWGDALFSIEFRDKINKEDGVIETASAIFLLIASAFCAIVAIYREPEAMVRVMHAFLCLLFFVMAGEEVSWAQRFLEIETPEALRKVNVQKEMNFHNLFGYFFDHLFILCFFLWGCVVPVLDRCSIIARNIFRSLGLPIPCVGLALCMLIATLTQGLALKLLGVGVEGLRPAELRELFSAASFLALASQSLRGFVHHPRDRENESTDPVPGE